MHEVDRPALVLGSIQPDAVVDRGRAARAGIEVVRRRSGGGAVLLRPGELLWIDVLLPASDDLWDDDVGRSFLWLGNVWRAALRELGVEGRVHEGPLVTTPWSGLVCFAGVGPGEVSVAGTKCVGLAQRRTRHGARFQCAALVAPWDPVPLLDLLVLDDDQRSNGATELASVAAPAGPAAAELTETFLAQLP